MHRPLGPFVLFVFALACGTEGPFEPPPVPAQTDATAEATATGARRIGVLTRNLYVGADVDAVIGALVSPSSDDDLAALTIAIQTLQRTDFPTRAGAIADEIARARPHAVGLQEVSEIHIDLTPLQIPVTLDLDFLPVLQQALAARGLHYVVGATVKNIEAAPLPGVSLVDYDALLVDADRVQITGHTSHTYAANIGQVAPGVVLKRGWVTVTGTVEGQSYLFASTHLESGNAAGLDQVRAAQASELATALAGTTPTVLMGDLNDHPDSPMYQVLAGAGLRDVWQAMRPGAAGFTCCHAADLSNPVANLTQRIDYVFARGLPVAPIPVLGSIEIVGAQPGDRVIGPAGSIWPSDHAGLAVGLLLPPLP
jgi:endonuclease/exonuclease/phosphatase family metal-dependent hydrolase